MSGFRTVRDSDTYVGAIPPKTPLDATPHGAYAYQRTRKRHAGLDIKTRPGDPIYAPEACVVIAAAFDDSTPPLSRYGPGAVMLRGASGWVHVLGHLSAWRWAGAPPAPGRAYAEGERIGTASEVGHVHWEVRRADRAPWPLASRLADTIDPRVWLADHADPAPATDTWGKLVDSARALAVDVKREVVTRATTSALLLVIALAVASRHGRRSSRR